jgi:MipA family protein
MKILKTIAVGFTLLASPALAQADGAAPSDPQAADWSGFVAAGPSLVPQYEGAKTYQALPFIAADVTYRSVKLELRGMSARLDVLGALSGMGNGLLYGGPAVQFSLRRDNKTGQTGNPIRLLTKIPAQVFAGGFIGLKFGGNAAGQGQFRVEATAVGGAKGFEAIGLVSYALVRSRKIFVDVDNSITYANVKYMRTYFGVTSADAKISGYDGFAPGAGVKSVGSALTVGYQFNARWGIVADASYSYLVGDAAKSPIIKGRTIGISGAGSRSQFAGGIGLLYRF